MAGSGVKRGEYFPEELGPDGKPMVAPDDFVEVDEAEWQRWLDSGCKGPLHCTVVTHKEKG